MQFTATYVEPSTNKTTANVMFADPETNPDEPSALLFSRSIEFPDSAYYFEINDQSYGSYGGLTSVRISRNNIEVQLTPRVVKKFGVDDFASVQIEFNIDDQTYQTILDTLRNIFANENIFVVE